ncbi:LuxR C-terminal-related transcriptional regulator [Streptomyces sp. CG1]|uniref:helix-turn-helix transcriptional regulator n=1 Tax=Streptomyces sp. CG1 TaxID=1287523 RepID=UPI0034E2A0AE
MKISGLQPNPGTAPAGSDLEQALLRMQVLVEEAVSKARNTKGTVDGGISLLSDPSDERILASARQLVSTARKSVSLALPYRGAAGPASGPAADAGLTALIDRLRPISAAGVAVRVLGGPGILDDPHVRRHLSQCQGELDIRISAHRHQGMVIVDEGVALLNVTFGSAGRQSMAIRVPGVLRALETLYTCAWSKATPAGYYRRVSVRGRNQAAQQVLRCLVSGSTDEAASQSLGLSVRTYRRHVAGIMQELGAGSRFQAGARAVQLGLLDAGVAVD